MGELGILQPSERTELIAGQILFMAAKGTPHVLSLRLLSTALDRLLTDLPFFVSTQDPIQLDDFSEPEPDCAVVRGTALNYATQHPNANDVVLVVEIADSTLKYDTEVKDKFYAQSGIADYWVLDIKNRQIHIFRDPTDIGYASHQIFDASHQMTLLALPNIMITPTDILPPLT
jgi:Uma2 family endonuclease